MEERITRLETHCEAIREDLAQIKGVLLGKERDGLIVRLDRLERDAERRKWQLRTTAAALIAVVVAVVKEWLTGV